MRLIDADSLLVNMDEGVQGTAREYLKFYQMAVKDEPTAYDVDKVMEQMRECAIVELGITKQQFEMDREEYSGYCALSLLEANLIVQLGGIDEIKRSGKK